MTRINNLFESFVSFDNLLLAWRKARRGCRLSAEVATFFYHLEPRLLELQQELNAGIYTPDPYRYFTIYEPKEREISVASFRDRIVHHALINILSPIYERIFIHDTYATRPEKGTHKAVWQAQKYCRQNPYYLKTDIQKYFNSIVHTILIDIISSKIKDKKLLTVISKIIAAGGLHGVSLPIGNLTSQFFANVYLHKFDFFVKSSLKVKHYVRYMDDMVMWSNSIADLKDIHGAITEYLRTYVKLQLKQTATHINQTYVGLSFLGCRIYPKTVRIRSENLKRYMGKMKLLTYRYETRKISYAQYTESISSYYSLLSAYDTFGLRSTNHFATVF